MDILVGEIMKRLTKNIIIEETINGYTDDVIAALRKLKKYEDLEDKCIKETTWSLRMLLEKWNIFFEDLAEVVRYRELEKAGLLHISPLKDGTSIYVIVEDFVDFGEKERYITKTSYLHGVTEYEIGEFNKDYWLTLKEAEKALSTNKTNQK